MCKLCKTKHWLNQEHRLGSVVDAMTGVKPALVNPTVSRETTVHFDWDARERELGLR
jgi:hypothetical protein